MRMPVAFVLVVFGCGTGGSGTASDAMTGADGGGELPIVQPDAPADTPATPDVAAAPDAPADIPATPPDARPDAPGDAPGDAPTPDAGTDAGPFSCGADLTCQGNQYCVPECCSTCGAITDGDPCPAGSTRCTLGSGIPGCMYCTRAMCINAIGGGCFVGNPVEPRRLTCRCG